MQRVYFPQSYFECRHYGKRFNSIEKFKSLTFQLRVIYFHTFADDMTVYLITTGKTHSYHFQKLLPLAHKLQPQICSSVYYVV